MTVRILTGDVRDILATLPDESVHCVVTSPPYWGLRDYGVPGQLGLEPTLGEHIETMVGVFRDVRRVLRKDGTVWLNYGDCYAGSNNTGGTKSLQGTDRRIAVMNNANRGVPDGLKPKDLCMIPNRLAIALQNDGWWVRSEIIWHKPNPMPESVTDRPAVSHEKVWLLSKATRYFYDADAVREAHKEPWRSGAKDESGVGYHSGDLKGDVRWSAPRLYNPLGRNLRNVWTIATAPFSEAHFATFPPALAEICIKAGCPAGGTVLDPFIGSGTTAMVADRLGRDCIGIELNPEYAAMARRRVEQDAGMFAEVAAQ